MIGGTRERIIHQDFYHLVLLDLFVITSLIVDETYST